MHQRGRRARNLPQEAPSEAKSSLFTEADFDKFEEDFFG
jgi:hypothetical protein